jgi:prolipoprotein diacylglyceryltransferase
MGIALYYAVLIGAVAGSVYYLRSGIKQLREWKAAPEDHPHVRAIALWKTGLGAFGTILWVTITIVSIYNQLSRGK